MPESESSYSRTMLREFEILGLLEQHLPSILGAKVIPEPRLGEGARPDFIATFPSAKRRSRGEGRNAKYAKAPKRDSSPNSRDTQIFIRRSTLGSVSLTLYLSSPERSHQGTSTIIFFQSGLTRVIDGLALKAKGVDLERASSPATQHKRIRASKQSRQQTSY